MKNLHLLAAAAAVAALTGCQHTHVDQVRAGDGMQAWYNDIKANYPGFRPPRLVSPGISGQPSRINTPAAPTAENNAVQTPAVDVVPTEIDAAPQEAPQVTPPAEPVKDAPEGNAPPAEPAKDAPEGNAPPAEPAKNAPAGTGKKAVEPPDPTNSQVYVVKSGDILSAISVKFYGSARYVNLIKKANADILPDANKLKPGMKLIIPKL